MFVAQLTCNFRFILISEIGGAFTVQSSSKDKVEIQSLEDPSTRNIQK